MLFTFQIFVLRTRGYIARGVWRNDVKIPNIKMAIITLYYMIVGVLGLITITYLEVKEHPAQETLKELFACESTGTRDCNYNYEKLDILDTLNELNVAVVSMIAFLPVVAVLFSLNFKKMCHRRTCSQSRQ